MLFRSHTLKPCVLPEAQWSICKGYYLIFHMTLMNHGCFRIQTFVLIVFLLHFTFFQRYLYPYTHPHSQCRYPSILDPMGNDIAMAFCGSENLIYQAEEEGEEDYEVPGELARLLQQEERVIQPHEESVDTINLGTEEEKKRAR